MVLHRTSARLVAACLFSGPGSTRGLGSQGLMKRPSSLTRRSTLPPPPPRRVLANAGRALALTAASSSAVSALSSFSSLGSRVGLAASAPGGTACPVAGGVGVISGRKRSRKASRSTFSTHCWSSAKPAALNSSTWCWAGRRIPLCIQLLDRQGLLIAFAGGGGAQGAAGDQAERARKQRGRHEMGHGSFLLGQAPETLLDGQRVVVRARGVHDTRGGGFGTPSPPAGIRRCNTLVPRAAAGART